MEVLKAALCDNETTVLPYMKAVLKKMFKEKGIQVETDCFSRARELWVSVCRGKNYQLYCLDIDISDFDSISLAKRLKRLYPESYVVFLSAMEERVFEIFSAFPTAFIRKKCFEKDLKKAVEFLYNYFFAPPDNRIYLEDALGHGIEIELDAVCYVEARDKYVDVVTLRGKKLVRQTITEMEKLLKNYGFIRIHRSILVNDRFLYRIEGKTAVLDNGMKLTISRRKNAKVKAQFLKSMK